MIVYRLRHARAHRRDRPRRARRPHLRRRRRPLPPRRRPRCRSTSRPATSSSSSAPAPTRPATPRWASTACRPCPRTCTRPRRKVGIDDHDRDCTRPDGPRVVRGPPRARRAARRRSRRCSATSTPWRTPCAARSTRAARRCSTSSRTGSSPRAPPSWRCWPSRTPRCTPTRRPAAAFVDVFTCGVQADPELVVDALGRELGAAEVRAQVVARGAGLAPAGGGRRSTSPSRPGCAGAGGSTRCSGGVARSGRT